MSRERGGRLAWGTKTQAREGWFPHGRKEPVNENSGMLREKNDSRAGPSKYKNEPGTPYVRKQASAPAKLEDL